MDIGQAAHCLVERRIIPRYRSVAPLSSHSRRPHRMYVTPLVLAEQRKFTITQLNSTQLYCDILAAAQLNS